MNFYVVSNFRIDSDIRLQRMKDSCSSFKDANISSWYINVRGSNAHLAKKYLEKQIVQPAKISCIESGKGWFHDTSSLIQDIDDGYILYWIEDHINIAGINTLNSVIDEIVRSRIDQIQYSFYNRAKYDSCKKLYSEENQHFRVVDFTIKTWDMFLTSCNERGLIEPYLISLQSIMSVRHFKSILSKRDPLLRRHSKHSPFDFEKNHSDIHWLPLKTGFLSTEIFANIDTDHDGLSLISRGLYKDSAAPISNTLLITSVSKVSTCQKYIFNLIKFIMPKSFCNFLKRITFHLK